MKQYGATPIKDVAGYLPRDKVVELVNASSGNIRDFVLLSTLALTGRRVSEIVGLRYRTGEDGNEVRLEEPLGGLRPMDLLEGDTAAFMILKRKAPTRKVKPIPAKLTKLLKEYIAYKNIKPEALIFPISRQRVDQIIKKYARLIGIRSVGNRKMGAHVFRHSYAISLIDKLNIGMLQELLGHASIDTTAHYLQYSTKDVGDKLEEALG